MPTREQIESVVEEIGRLQSGRAGDKPWAALTHGEKYVALDDIEWAGFTRREEMVVVGRILAGEPPELWMEGMDRGESAHEEVVRLPPHPWPSEVARDSRQEPPEQDRGRDHGFSL